MQSCVFRVSRSFFGGWAPFGLVVTAMALVLSPMAGFAGEQGPIVTCGTTTTFCGNEICEPSIGEDCLSCPTDCRGRQNGSPGNRYCCGDGAGQNPVGCGDARCNSQGFDCERDDWCGNGDCEPASGEDCLSCPGDCRGRQNGAAGNRFCCGDGAGQNPVGCNDPRCDQQGYDCELPGSDPGDDDEGNGGVQILFDAEGTCGDVQTSAVVDLGCRQVEVDNGQIVEIKCHRRCRSHGGHGDDDDDDDDDDDRAASKAGGRPAVLDRDPNALESGAQDDGVARHGDDDDDDDDCDDDDRDGDGNCRAAVKSKDSSLVVTATDACGTSTCVVVLCGSGAPCEPSPEVCDGRDNDCNGAVDEGLGSLTCGEGDCAVTVPLCANGAFQTCNPAASNGASCEDGNACTINDTCSAGSCAGGGARSCDDSSVCTVDTCNPATGCVFHPISCDDSNSCTVDTCNPVVGCLYGLTVCIDFDVCDGIRSCDPATGNCVNSPVPSCDDLDPCTADSCHPVNGCASTPITCADDNNPCTTESCIPGVGCQSVPVSCADGNPCTIDSCDPSTGDCVQTPTCDDHNLCTNDSCDPLLPVPFGCQHTPIVCSDGNPCTDESCNPSSGECVYTSACDDGDSCTIDSCDPLIVFPFGCGHTPIACDDGNPCTNDMCFLGTCLSTAGCQSHGCLTGSCNPGVGCVYESNCSDDGVECSVETCDPILGCQRVYTNSLCNDGNPCTADYCQEAGCVNIGVNCDDGNACTADSCVDSDSCLHIAISCVDNDPCTPNMCDPDVGCLPAAQCGAGQQCENGACCWTGAFGIGCDFVTPCCGGLTCVFTSPHSGPVCSE